MTVGSCQYLIPRSAPSLTASFVYEGDGNRVKRTINDTATTFVGNYYEVSSPTVTKYYYAGSSRVAMSVGGTVYYVLSDQLGSTAITALGHGTKTSELRYKAWGEVRYTNGTMPTDYTYTGQYSNVNDFGPMFYNARWYDPTIGRFIQPDTVVPDGPESFLPTWRLISNRTKILLYCIYYGENTYPLRLPAMRARVR